MEDTLLDSAVYQNIEYFKGVHKVSKHEVDVKAISKKDMTPEDIEKLREEIAIYKLVVHHGVVRLLDYFEHRDCLFLCLERSNEVYH